MDAAPLDITTPNPARVYDYLLGGRDNFAADRKAAEALEALNPDARACVSDNAAFLGRAAAWAAGRGIAQYLDLGCGFPRPGMAHEGVEGARAVYVDSDARVAAHVAHYANVMAWGPSVAVVRADLRDVEAVMAAAKEVGVNLAEPVAVIFGAVLHYLPADEAREAVAAYASLVAPGSAVIVSVFATNDDELAARIDAAHPAQLYRHPANVIAGWLDGLELVAPGIVTARGWRPGWGNESTKHRPACVLAGVGLRR